MSKTTQLDKNVKKHQIFEAFRSYENQFATAVIAEKAGKTLSQINKLDFPTSKSEYWKYTRVNKITKNNFSFQKDDSTIDLTPYIIPELDCHTLVFVNGFYRQELSCKMDQTGLTLMPLSEVQNESTLLDNYGKKEVTDTEIFAALNSSYPSDGAFIVADKNVQVSKPIHVIFLTSGLDVISQPRNLFIAEQGSKLEVIVSEFCMDNTKSFTNGISEIVVEANASVSVDLIQKQNDDSYLLNQVDASQAKDSRFMINTLSVEGAWIRNNLNIKVEGENCETHLNGTYAPKGKSHVDNHTVVDHMVPHCESHELYKGILYDNSTAVFNGKVFVRPDAQLTNAYQQNANILISDDANVYSKPELEIYADDVKCSHGSTIGQFDEDALFYLMVRGISKDNAKKLLVDAFVGDVIGKISDLKVRKYVSELF